MLFIAIVILAISLGWMGWMLGGMRIARQGSAPNAPVWDLGPTWPASVQSLAPLGAGLIGGGLVWTITHNVGEVLGLGLTASMIPGWIRLLLRRRRHVLLDTQFYTLANTLRLLLPITANLVIALRDARETAESPLADVLTAALRRETRQTGAATEFIRDVGRDLGLGEVELLGDVLTQVRTQTVQASDLLTNLTMMWGDRLQTEQKRAGKITGSQRLGLIMLGITILIQLGWPLVSQTVATLDRGIIAAVFGAVASGITFGAFTILMNQTQKVA
ncbi:hypothetical protein SAMN00768000_0174 [Sulfobacillus thermosulfidooxidans DSM 9293]|uniref:Type II secretion system protein GspF domain-containing protein n=1 Tax=Sulfobacillus thermosulfidooxidans (strain DSM 9293 / VKM B-1269 / AT-1) TaxID=929705 RepID=A0A1W1W6P3_SULTA|nr:hypothetical protein [Sulfobacillus thermosulfidooxidans]SMC01946.1 hypothetical protein SAMN00768000_0174 [Sulfobacillus thermosulfidooxidans DSM 9293]